MDKPADPATPFCEVYQSFLDDRESVHQVERAQVRWGFQGIFEGRDVVSKEEQG